MDFKPATRRISPAKVKRSIGARKMRQTLSSVPHYLFELRQARNVGDLGDWLYYKAPNAFPLRDHPTVLKLELTNDCNFACPHRPRDALNQGRAIGVMDADLYSAIVDEAAGRVPMVKLIGLGEPALHPRLDQFMGQLRGGGFRTLIYTNGTLFARYSPEAIFAWEAEEVVVSIDGLDARGFERLRVGGNDQRLYDSLEAFHACRARHRGPTPRIEVRHVTMPCETPEMLDLLAAFSRERFADTVKYCFLGAPYESNRESVPQRPACRDIRREMHVRVDGRVPLCGYEGHREWTGDLRQSTLGEVWRAARLEEVRRLHARRDLSDLPSCATCQFW